MPRRGRATIESARILRAGTALAVDTGQGNGIHRPVEGGLPRAWADRAVARSVQHRGICPATASPRSLAQAPAAAERGGPFCAAGRTFLLFSAGKRRSSFVISMDIFVVWKFLRLLKGVFRLSRSFLLLFGAALRLFDDFLRSFGGVRKRPRAARENGAPTAIAGMGKHERRRQPFVSGALAHLAGFEPTACRLGGGRSILLSYKCMCGNVHYTVFPRACQAKAHEIGARRTK